MQNYAADRYTNLVGEGFITVFPWNYSAITQGTFTWADTTSQLYDGYYYNSSNAQNDQIDYKVYLDAGTYTYSTLCYYTSTCAIVTVLIDAVSVGTYDLYAAGATFNQIKTITSIAVTSPGLKTVSLKVATRNVLSTGWYIAINNFVLFRTA